MHMSDGMFILCFVRALREIFAGFAWIVPKLCGMLHVLDRFHMNHIGLPRLHAGVSLLT